MANLLANRWMHSIVLTAFVATIILGLPDTIPRPELIYAVFVIAGWMLGQRYEREIIIDSGLVDREEIKQIERGEQSFWTDPDRE